MNNVFGCGVSWGDHRNNKSYMNIFLDKNIAFAGPVNKYTSFNKIKSGDYIVMKQGTKAFYVGKSLGGYEAVNIKEIIENYKDYGFNEKDIVALMHVEKWVDISQYNEQVDMKAFFKIGIRQNPYKFINYYENNYSVKKNNNLFIDNLGNKLLKSKNLILTGAPGTGKTYLAKKIAESIVLSGLSEDEIQDKIDKILENQTAFVQFHPSYDYTDFVEGIKPNKDNSFERQDGIFKKFCKSALEELPEYNINEDDIEEDDNSQNVSEYDKLLVEKLHEFINDLQKECEKEPVKLKGFTGKDISPLTSVQYTNDKIIFTIKGSKSQEEKIKETRIPFFIGAYKRFIENDVDKYSTKLFVEHVKFWWSPTSFYGFIRKFYDKYNNELKQIKGSEYKAKKYVFIIDEINRGDLNKILGELFYAVDPGYRGIEGKVKTQYINLIDDESDPFKDGFYIPENVYIIGTMNDIDRSVDSMDFAVRRRFAWQEITYDMTDDEILSNLKNQDIITLAKERLQKLNNKITEIIGSEYNIGASYFLKLNECDDFDDLWENFLYGILFEYFRTYPKEDRERYLNIFENIILGNEENNNEDIQ